MKKLPYQHMLFLLFTALCVLFFLALSLGRYSSNPLNLIHVFLSKMGLVSGQDRVMENVVFSIRLPRIFASILVGAMLAVSGASYQGIFQNPLVSPDLLGVSAGASVGAAGAILLGLNILERQMLAFVGGLLAVLMATTIPRLFRNRSNMMLVLSGILVGGFLSSLLAIMKFVAEEQTELSAIVFWQMGSISTVHMGDVIAISPVFFVCALLLIAISWRINILSFGDLEARTLGVPIQKMRALVIVCASLLTASAVSISGTIGWIGLVVPHLGRLLAGADHTRLLPVTVVLGAVFMLLMDTLARSISSVEIPLSILTGFVGAPVFTLLLYRQKMQVQ